MALSNLSNIHHNNYTSLTKSKPSAPTGVSATLSSGSTVSVSFTGSSSATGYTVTSSPGSITGTGTSSPISVSGLLSFTTYTFTVIATNSSGSSSSSSASNSVTTTLATTNLILHLPVDNNLNNSSTFSSTVSASAAYDSNTVAVGSASYYCYEQNNIAITSLVATVPSGLSVSFWMKINGSIIGTTSCIFNLEGTNTTGNGIIFYNYYTGSLTGSVSFSSGPTITLYNLGYSEYFNDGGEIITVSVDGSWYHVVIVAPYAASSSSSLASIYINNVLKYNGNYSLGAGNYPTTPSGSLRASFGANIDGGMSGLVSTNLDDIRIYNTMLNATQVSYLYNLKKSGIPLGT